MTELPKRTGLRSDPEDAAFFRRYHDEVGAALRRGFSVEQVRQELAAKGVPDKTAKRIVIAVEQEIRLAEVPTSGGSGKPFWLFTWIGPLLSAGLLLAVCTGGYAAWHFGGKKRIPGRKALIIAVVVVSAGAELLRRQFRK